MIRCPWSLLFSGLNKLSSLSLSSQKRCIFVASSGPTSTALHPFCAGGPGLDTVLQMGPYKGRAEGGMVLSLSLLPPLLMQPRVQLAFWDAGTQRWLMSSFLSTRTPKPFSAGLLSRSLHMYL